MARPRSSGYDAQAELILATAAQAFAESGFPSASMNDIARRCGVSKGLLYHYYPSKERLLFDLTDQYTRRLVAIVEAVERRLPDAAARLPALIRAFLDEYRTSQAHHMILLHDLRFLPSGQAAGVRGNQRRVVSAFAAAIRASYALPADAEVLRPLTMMLFGMMNWTFTWLQPDAGAPRKGRISYAEYADMVATVFGSGAGAIKARARHPA